MCYNLQDYFQDIKPEEYFIHQLKVINDILILNKESYKYQEAINYGQNKHKNPKINAFNKFLQVQFLIQKLFNLFPKNRGIEPVQRKTTELIY